MKSVEEEMLEWGPDNYPVRALRWAVRTMQVNIGETQTLFKHGEIKGRKYVSALSYLNRNKKEYYALLERLGLKQNIYDQFI